MNSHDLISADDRFTYNVRRYPIIRIFPDQGSNQQPPSQFSSPANSNHSTSIPKKNYDKSYAQHNIHLVCTVKSAHQQRTPRAPKAREPSLDPLHPLCHRPFFTSSAHGSSSHGAQSPRTCHRKPAAHRGAVSATVSPRYRPPKDDAHARGRTACHAHNSTEILALTGDELTHKLVLSHRGRAGCCACVRAAKV